MLSVTATDIWKPCLNCLSGDRAFMGLPGGNGHLRDPWQVCVSFNKRSKQRVAPPHLPCRRTGTVVLCRVPPQVGFFRGIWGMSGGNRGASPLFHPPRQTSTVAPPNQRERQVQGGPGSTHEWSAAAGRAGGGRSPTPPTIAPGTSGKKMVESCTSSPPLFRSQNL